MVDEKIKKDFLKIITLYIRFISKRDKFLNFIKRVKPIPQILKIFNPRYGVCKKCGLPWNHCEEKSIATDKFTYVFATCDYCWQHSTIDELKKIYTDFYYEQQKSANLYSYKLLYTLPEFLEFVQRDYYSKYSGNEYNRIIRKQKLQKILSEKTFNDNF